MKWSLLSKSPWIHVGRLIGITIGSIIAAISINTLIIPNTIADGGVTGIAILLHYIFEWPVSWFVLFINIPLFIIGWKMVGRSFLLYSIFGVFVFSLGLDQIASLPISTDDTLLAAIFGGVTTGIGLGIIFRCQGSLGGTDILAVFFSRKISVSVGQVLLIIDAVIFLVAAIVLSPESAMYAMIYMFVATRVIDLVQEGTRNSKSVLVVTTEPTAIAQDIMRELERGVTFFNAVGAFSGEPKQVIYCVINRAEMSRLKGIVYHRDPRAFLAISEVPEVVGEGFSSWKGH